MEKRKKARLEARGWKIGDAKEFLNLSDEELEYIEIKLALSQSVRRLRREKGLTQEQTAQLIGSSQSRVAKMEAGDPSVSVDLLVKMLLTLGASREKLAEMIGTNTLAAV